MRREDDPERKGNALSISVIPQKTSFGDEWKPTQSKMVLRIVPREGHLLLFATVDPGYCFKIGCSALFVEPSQFMIHR
jgi:hypothetical protein